jgi:hypothetical protein
MHCRTSFATPRSARGRAARASALSRDPGYFAATCWLGSRGRTALTHTAYPMTEHNPSDPSDATFPALPPTTSPALQNYFDSSLARIRQRLPQFAELLRKAGVARVHVEYTGSGDDGAIGEITLLLADGAPLPSEPIGISEEELKEVFYDLAQIRHPLWQDGEGANGEFAWDLTAEMSLQHTHRSCYIAYDITEHSGL